MCSRSRSRKNRPLSRWRGRTLASRLAVALIEPSEHRALSKASGAAGGYLVPPDFGGLITSAGRARNVIGGVGRVIETDYGRSIPLPTVTAHGRVVVSENAAVSVSHDTFGQVTVGAYKASAKTIVSQGTRRRRARGLRAYLGDELGQRLALLEEAAFAQEPASSRARL